MRGFVLFISLSVVGSAMAMVATGCACEEYYCDATGCYLCDGVGCRAIEPPARVACEGSCECSEGSVCTALGCTATCESDAGCAQGSVCQGGLCVGPTEADPGAQLMCMCVRNTDCPDSSFVCRDGACVPDDMTCGESGCSCAATGMCSAGFLCVDDECRPEENTCHFDHECGPDRLCVNAHCVNECTTNAQCLQGQRCASGRCEEIPMTGECMDNNDCTAAGEICVDSACVLGCANDADCGRTAATACREGSYCAAGTCRAVDRPCPFCSSDADCSAGHPCVGGICRTPCSTDQMCLRVDVQFGFCLEGFCSTSNEATSDCRTNADCTSDRMCIDGICR